MNWPEQLFYWTGFVTLMTILVTVFFAVVTKILWDVLNAFEDAFAKNTAVFSTYLRVLARKAFDGREEDVRNSTITRNGYRYSITVEPVSQTKEGETAER